MKKVFAIFAFCMATVFGANAQGQPVPVGQSGPAISVDKDIHDYGTIEQNADPFCSFTITNTGDAPLLITNAKGSCGCTVPEWSKEPVMPGKTTIMKVRYDTKRIGPINKSVTITSNATNEPTKVLRIKGLVEKPASDNTAPLNTKPVGPVDNN